MQIEKIITSRLAIRGFTADDARFAISIWNDLEMGEYLSDPALEEEKITPEYLREIENLGEDEECCYLISEDWQTGKRIGTCSFIPSEDGKVYDIAYCVHKSHWRQGYATEMIRGMIEYARGRGAEKITVTVDKRNIASNGVMKKLGFRIAADGKYKKRGTDQECSDYKYELLLS
ncbi:MAG: GNAT family N-acetyltransferase [Lachnospiraceae bacterium]|nr:GNAT family N-acetyltransferase [uncultured Acetatifactor sp.]MCI8286583.1 GNAT family N-acetyltransferase [Lachnospiraceae bacterium]